MIESILIVASPLMGFIAACIAFTLLVLGIRFAKALAFIYWPSNPKP